MKSDTACFIAPLTLRLEVLNGFRIVHGRQEE